MSASDLAMSVRGLSKAYTIAHQQEKHVTLAETMLAKLRNPFKRTPTETFWALKDVSFDIKKGEVVGIIGRNGAGKSTLLKVLSRITEPTSGVIDLYGRVGSLLEVGTGFHPELTGRENIFLNGAILGMTRGEIRKQFDAIVDFAGVEQFLDTPVKRYSSGMYVRLAFAVAAHLRTEILLVDEVLAVGDTHFQSKCIGKMSEVARSGRTVILVSHNMASVSNLCTLAGVLNSGSLAFLGETSDAVGKYVTLQRAPSQEGIRRNRPKWAAPLITSVECLNSAGNENSRFQLGEDISIEVGFDTSSWKHPLAEPVLGVVIHHPVLGVVGGVNSRMTRFIPSSGPYKRARMRCTLRRVPLLQGTYTADVWLGDGPADLDTVQSAVSFDIEATDIYGTGMAPFREMGTVYFLADWRVQESHGCSAACTPPGHDATPRKDGSRIAPQPSAMAECAGGDTHWNRHPN